MESFPDHAETPVALTIATSDSGGGAGIQADLKTFAARGVFGASVFCALTAQNPREVTAIAELEKSFITAQLEAVFSFFKVGAAKTGMLFSARNITTVTDFLAGQPQVPLVVDPVMVATSGAVLLREDAIAALTTRLLPRAQLITPNLDEAGVLLGSRPRTRGEMREAARALADRFGAAILLKGGHLEQATRIPDILCWPGEEAPFEFSHARIDGVNTHGSGCTLSAAITAELAGGNPLATAVENALAFVESTLRHPVTLNGEQFIGH
jgi:hydroxymethylpyrimidine/phosphomethylpyrimidine kinase